MTSNAPITLKFLDFLGRTYAGRPLSEAELLIVHETWAMAQVPQKTGAPSIADIVKTHTMFTDPLLDRVQFVQKVIFRTLRKITGETPPELEWVLGSIVNIQIVGIRRPRTVFPEHFIDVAADIRSGKTDAELTDVVRVLITRHATVKTQTVDIPLSTLASSNSTDVAQVVRAVCRKHAAKLDAETAQADVRADLEQRIALMQEELRSMDSEQKPRDTVTHENDFD
jgi:hypothetical protein